MDSQENAVSLSDFISSIPVSSLPRILQITSGVYLQSSVYDISGSECCMSTGDLLKVVDKELQSVSIENLQTGKKKKLKSNFKGAFQVSVDNCIHDTLYELLQKISSDYSGHPYWFTSASDFTVEERVIQKLLPIQILSTDRHTAECRIFEGPHSFNIKIPLSTNGQFYEYENEELYTLDQILQEPSLTKRNFKCQKCGPGIFRLCPEYEIKTIMQMRKGFVKMPSSLEVDVVDITDYCGNITFIQPLSLTDIFDQQQKFPVVAEILDAAEVHHLVKNDIYATLQNGQKIIIYRKIVSKKVLATGIKGKTSKYFYIYDSYQGKFRQRPREFASIFELWTKALEGIKLKVVVTQDCDSCDENFPSLYIGDHLQVLYHTKTVLTTSIGPRETDVLVFNKGTVDEDDDDDDDDDDEDKPEEIMLPIYMEGRFVEEVKDTKKYKLFNIIQKLTLPCEVKVVTKDTSLLNDPLASLSSIRLEEITEESALFASLYDNPSECFELPIKYFNISVVLLENTVSSAGLTNSTKVEELTECFYYNLRKDIPSQQLPPPRPPKREMKAKETILCKPLQTRKTLPAKLKASTESTPPTWVEPYHSGTPPCGSTGSYREIVQVLPSMKSETFHSGVPTIHQNMSSKESKRIKEICNVQKNMYSSTPKINTAAHEDTDSDDGYEQVDEKICQLKVN